MKKFILLLLLAASFPLAAKEINVLTIGNSFSASVLKYLPDVTASVPDCKLVITGANIGGCSLERHWKEWQTAEKDPKHHPYGVTVIDSSDPAKRRNYRGNVNTLIRKHRYDIITIQQNSANSWRYESYQPFADNLIAELKKYQPQAEIIIQQTWSYRSDANLLRKWKITGDEMYQKLNDAYSQLAKKHQFRMIPCGHAVQIFRAKTPVKFQRPDRKALEQLKNTSQHAYEGDVVGYCRWGWDRRQKVHRLICDSNHLNFHGQFMQAAIWFGFLFDRPVADIKHVPENIAPEQVKLLLNCAQEALDTFKQPGK